MNCVYDVVLTHIVGQSRTPQNAFSPRTKHVRYNSHSTHLYAGTAARRVQAGASAWRKVEGIMGDRCISRQLKGKVLSSCITPAYLYGLQTLVMTEKQQGRLQVCENNCVRRIKYSEVVIEGMRRKTQWRLRRTR